MQLSGEQSPQILGFLCHAIKPFKLVSQPLQTFSYFNLAEGTLTAQSYQQQYYLAYRTMLITNFWRASPGKSTLAHLIHSLSPRIDPNLQPKQLLLLL